MGKAQRPRIKFDSLNSRLLYLVCEDPDACLEMIHSFEEAKFEVHYLQNFNDLYACLESGRLGYILLSRDIEEAFGDAHLASFVQRRFNVPIFSFLAGPAPEGTDETTAISASPEIVHLASGLSVDEIIHDLICFEEDYVSEANEAKETGPATKYDELLVGLRKMVTEVPLKVTAGQSMKVMALRVKSGDEKFILMCGVPLPANQTREDALKMSLRKFLEAQFPESEVSQSQIFDSLTIEEFRKLASGASHHWAGRIGPVDCMLALIAESEELNKAEEHTHGRCIPLEDWLKQDTLAFEVFHYLERNQKLVRYARAGRKFDALYFDRFTKRGITYLLIQEADLDRYEILRQFINSRAA